MNKMLGVGMPMQPQGEYFLPNMSKIQKNVDGDIETPGYITGKKSGVYLALEPDDPLNTYKIQQVDTWETVALGLNIRVLEDFSLGAGGLTEAVNFFAQTTNDFFIARINYIS